MEYIGNGPDRNSKGFVLLGTDLHGTDSLGNGTERHGNVHPVFINQTSVPPSSHFVSSVLSLSIAMEP